MVGKSMAERKQAERDRKVALGLQRYEVWLRPSEWRTVQRDVERIARNRHMYDENGALISKQAVAARKAKRAKR